MINDQLIRTIQALQGTNLARLAIPQPSVVNNYLLSDSLAAKMKAMTEMANKNNAVNRLAITGLAPHISEIAKMIEQKYKPQIFAVQSITDRLQSIITQQTKFASDYSKIFNSANSTIEIFRNLSSFNAFQKYQTTFKKFGGGINLDDYTEEEIEQTIQDNQELFNELNGAVLQAENDGVAVGDIPGYIYSYLVKILPRLSVSTFNLVILIYFSIILSYQIYSAYSTNKAIDDKINPKLDLIIENQETQSEMIGENKEIIDSLSTEFEKTQDKNDSTNLLLKEIQENFEEYKEQSDNKLDLLIDEMKKISDKNQE